MGERALDVQFASPRAIPVSGGSRPTPPAPGAPREPETIAVKWDGADTITGVVMAAATRGKQLEIQLALFARKDLTLHDGETANLTLVPVKVPVVKRPRPRVITPKEDRGFDPVYREDYQLTGTGGTVRGPGRAGKAYDIPDLRGFGLEPARSLSRETRIFARRVQCGLDRRRSRSLRFAPQSAGVHLARFRHPREPRHPLRLVGGALERGLPSHPGGRFAVERPSEDRHVTMQTSVGWPTCSRWSASGFRRRWRRTRPWSACAVRTRRSTSWSAWR